MKYKCKNHQDRFGGGKKCFSRYLRMNNFLLSLNRPVIVPSVKLRVSAFQYRRSCEDIYMCVSHLRFEESQGRIRNVSSAQPEIDSHIGSPRWQAGQGGGGGGGGRGDGRDGVKPGTTAS